MWLEVFHQNYSKAAERYHECRLEPLKVEGELLKMPRGPVSIASVIDTLQRSDCWNYKKWWPPASEDFLGSPIGIPENLSEEGSRKEIIKSLYARLKNIECVSIILRFLRPAEFGIISFPVTNLINLPQAKNATDYYLMYLRSLRKLRKHCGGSSLLRVADIDMALWSAAHFSQDADLGADFEALKQATEEMRQDEKFQELRFQNLLSGLQLKEKSVHQQMSMRLVFAGALVEHDHRVASVITAKVYESLIHEIAKVSGLPAADGKERTNWNLVDDLEQKGTPATIGIEKGKLRTWLRWRNRAVHENLEPLSPSEAERFVAEVSELLGSWRKTTV